MQSVHDIVASADAMFYIAMLCRGRRSCIYLLTLTITVEVISATLILGKGMGY